MGNINFADDNFNDDIMEDTLAEGAFPYTLRMSPPPSILIQEELQNPIHELTKFPTADSGCMMTNTGATRSKGMLYKHHLVLVLEAPDS